MTYELYNEDFLQGVARIPDASVDLVVADPPYGLGKDFGNDSDVMTPEEIVEWTQRWVDVTIPKLKPTAMLYIFTHLEKFARGLFRDEEDAGDGE